MATIKGNDSIASVIGNTKYGTVGSSSAPLLLKSNGTIRCLWGNKFIDLIKHGKINADTKVIFNEDKVGSKDGIYVVNKIPTLVSEGEEIALTSENSGISYTEELTLTSDQKLLALKNIGFIYNSLDEIQGILNGIVYIVSLGKLYNIVNGVSKEYINVSTVTTELQETELKVNNNTFDIINSDNPELVFSIQNSKSTKISGQGLSAFSLISNTVKSADESYTLVNNDGYSILTVDKVIERDPDLEVATLLLVLSKGYYYSNNLITSISKLDNGNLELTFALKKAFNDGAILTSWYSLEGILKEVTFTVISSNTESTIVSSNNEDYENCIGQSVFLTGPATLYPVPYADYKGFHILGKVDITESGINVGDTKITNSSIEVDTITANHLDVEDLNKFVTKEELNSNFTTNDIDVYLYSDFIGRKLGVAPSSINCLNDTNLKYFPYIETDNLTNLDNAFKGCTNLSYIKLVECPNVTSVVSMFEDCKSLTRFTFPKMDKLTSLKDTFKNCNKLVSLDLSNLSNINNVENAFSGCSLLQSINLDGWNFDSINNAFLPSNLMAIDGTIKKSDGLNVSNLPNLDSYSCNKIIKALSLTSESKDYIFNSGVQSKISDAYLQLAEQKGWNIVFM